MEEHDDRGPLEGAELHQSEELLMMNAKCVHPTTAPVSSQLTATERDSQGRITGYGPKWRLLANVHQSRASMLLLRLVS